MKRESKKRPAGGEKKKRRLGFTQIVCLLALALGIGMAVWTLRPGNTGSAAQIEIQDGQLVWKGDPIEAQEIDYGDGDMLLRPGSEDIRYDEETGTLYFQNLLTVFFCEQPEDGEAESLAAAVGGEVAGLVREGCWFAQIRVPETDFAGLEALAQQLMDGQDNVFYARHDYPVFVEPTLSGEDTNPWGGDSPSHYDEEAVDGKNWWAEAIGAYTAWQYTDWCADYTIGIVDSGFDFKHPEFSGRITSLYEQDPETLSTDEFWIDHGTHVTGIIGAANNTKGIRGIADTAELLVVNWSGFADSDEALAANAKMVRAGARVVNNSWGNTVDSILDSAEKIRNAIDTGMDALILIQQMVASGEDQFLIVKSAGNGLKNEGEVGYDTKWQGDFNAVSYARNEYETRARELYGHVNRTAVSYDELRSHILIVGGLMDDKNEKGQYKAWYGYNFGSEVDIYAPSREIYSTYSDGEYEEMSGTSMAAPMVTASAGMLWALCPELTTEEVRSYLLEYGDACAVDVDGNDAAMLQIGKSVEALVHAKGITGRPEQTDSDAEATEPTTPGTSGVRASKGDDSAGTYWMDDVAESGEKLYYTMGTFDNLDSQDEKGLYCYDLVTGEAAQLLQYSYFTGSILATQNYLYLEGPSGVQIYNFAGQKLASAKTGDSVCFNGGYLYYESGGYVNRVSVVDILAYTGDGVYEGGERLSEERIDGSYLLDGGYIYYWSDDTGELMRMSCDGSSSAVMTCELSNGLSFDTSAHDHVYNGWLLDKNYNDGAIYALEFAGSDEVTEHKILDPVKDPEADSDSIVESVMARKDTIDDGFVIGNVYVYCYENNTSNKQVPDSYWGCELDTGETFEILEDTQGRYGAANMMYVSGQTRLYYLSNEDNETNLGMSTEETIGAMLASPRVKYVELYGGSERELNIPASVF